jgi:hypothetical protein
MMRWMQRGALISVAAVLPALQACYTYAPLATPAPATGETYVFDVSDRGRVDLAERFGAGLTEIEGRLAGVENAQYLINVFRVSHLNGQTALWSGESSRISRENIGTVRGRKLSRGRTALAVAGGAAAVVAILASTGLLGNWTGDPEGPGEGEPPISVRIPLFPLFVR